MMNKGEFGKWCAALILAGLCFAPSGAFAETECSSDADCGENFVCQSSTAPCPAIACDSIDGEGCPEQPVCEPETTSQCVPAPPGACETAADCESGLVCVTYTFESCSAGVACPEGAEECPEPTDEPACTSETEGYCLPPYLAPCEADADCGSGFTCEAQESCGCSSGGSTGTPVDGPAPEPIDAGSANVDGGSAPDERTDAGSSETTCECEPTGRSYCELVEVECSSDADCAGDLVCRTMPGATESSPDTACAYEPDGGTICEDEPILGDTPEETTYCVPADIERWFGAAVPGNYRGDESATDSGQPGGGTENGAPESDEREVLGASVDRGSSAAPSEDGSAQESGCGCASTGDSIPAAGSFAALFFLFMGFVGIRRRR